MAWRRTVLQETVLRRPDAVRYCAAPGIGVVLVQSYAHHKKICTSQAYRLGCYQDQGLALPKWAQGEEFAFVVDYQVMTLVDI